MKGVKPFLFFGQWEMELISVPNIPLIDCFLQFFSSSFKQNIINVIFVHCVGKMVVREIRSPENGN